MNVRRLPSLRTISVSGLLALLILLLTAETARAQALTMNVGPDLGAFSTGEMQYSLIATGGNGTYAWDITAGGLPGSFRAASSLQRSHIRCTMSSNSSSATRSRSARRGDRQA